MNPLCQRAFLLALSLSMMGCDELQNAMEGSKSTPPQIAPTPASTQNQQGTAAPSVDRAKVDEIEKQDEAKGVVRAFQAGLPTQRTDAMLLSLSEVPQELFTLTDLDLASSQVTDEGLKSVVKMRRLESLDLSFLNFTERGLVGLRELPNLRKLKMVKSKFPGGPCLQAIGQLAHLEELTLSECLITDADIFGLRDLPHLKVLRLDGTPVTDGCFEHLATLPQLEELTVAGTVITSQGLRVLCGVPNSPLRILNVYRTRAGLNGFADLDGLRSLEDFDARESRVTDQSLRGWKSPPNLRRLVLAGNSFTNASLPGILQSPRLEELDLQKVTGITDAGLNFIVKKTSLRFVQLDQTGVGLQSAQRLKQMMPDTRVGIAGTIY